MATRQDTIGPPTRRKGSLPPESQGPVLHTQAELQSLSVGNWEQPVAAFWAAPIWLFSKPV